MEEGEKKSEIVANLINMIMQLMLLGEEEGEEEEVETTLLNEWVDSLVLWWSAYLLAVHKSA